jgi:hypothetical protein
MFHYTITPLSGREDAVECALCLKPLDGPSSGSWAEADGERYPVCDEECRRLVTEFPVEALGPLAELRYREGCERCTRKIKLWQDATGRRLLRLRLKESPELGECPELWLNGEPDPITGEIDDLDELLGWLYTSYPGFAGCC